MAATIEYGTKHLFVSKIYFSEISYESVYIKADLHNLGSLQERNLYANISLSDFIQRLLTKRCVSFVGRSDAFLLITGQDGHGNNYATIGTNSEKQPLVLKDCLSYDEVKLSAFLSISSHTELLNDGNRQNRGIIETDLNRIEREGVVIGIIGARFQRPFVMDYQDIVISAEQNVVENGYGQKQTPTGVWGTLRSLIPDIVSTAWGRRDLTSKKEYRKLWQRFYDNTDFLYDEVHKDHKRFGDVARSTDEIFDNVLMKKRYTITFDTLLLETQARAAILHKQAYLHVVGIGLGTWRTAEQQTDIFLETFSQRVQQLLPSLNNIGVLHFSWFQVKECGDLKHNGFIASETHPFGGIRTFMDNRNPADKLKNAEFENMLLVISYAWDGNALPGNEFWFKHLAGSNDSSTACSTLITELNNPHINTEWVCGDNLHIVMEPTESGGRNEIIAHISDYAKKISEDL